MHLWIAVDNQCVCLEHGTHFIEGSCIVNDDWCIPFSSAILALIIAPVLVLDIYFLVLVVKFDEKLRNGSEDIKWPNATHTTTTIIEKEYFELGAMRNQSEISNSDNYTSYLE